MPTRKILLKKIPKTAAQQTFIRESRSLTPPNHHYPEKEKNPLAVILVTNDSAEITTLNHWRNYFFSKSNFDAIYTCYISDQQKFKTDGFNHEKEDIVDNDDDKDDE